jgi:predicted DCC family thiol-disulfide oxidoreductase YuxK
MTAAPEAPGPVILFDGVCRFCAWSVRFVIERDPRGVFRFASLQSEAGRGLLRDHGLSGDAMDSMALIDQAGVWRESDAALRICRCLRAPWRYLAVLRFVPKFLRDPLYRLIARNRYRWFGKSDTCLVPSPGIRARFLD